MRNTAETSRRSYATLVASGLPITIKNAVVSVLSKSPEPLSRRELALRCGVEPGTICGPINDLLYPDLPKQPVLRVAIIKPCRHTGTAVEHLALIRKEAQDV